MIQPNLLDPIVPTDPNLVELAVLLEDPQLNKSEQESLRRALRDALLRFDRLPGASSAHAPLAADKKPACCRTEWIGKAEAN
jgi:hypothetical protein